MSIIDSLVKPSIETTVNTTVDMSNETNHTNNVEKIEHHYHNPIILQISDAETAVKILEALERRRIDTTQPSH